VSINAVALKLQSDGEREGFALHERRLLSAYHGVFKRTGWRLKQGVGKTA